MNSVLYRNFCWDSTDFNTSRFNPAVFTYPEAKERLPRELLKYGGNSLFFIDGHYTKEAIKIPDALVNDIETLLTPGERKVRLDLKLQLEVSTGAKHIYIEKEANEENQHQLLKPHQIDSAINKNQRNDLLKKRCFSESQQRCDLFEK